MGLPRHFFVDLFSGFFWVFSDEIFRFSFFVQHAPVIFSMCSFRTPDAQPRLWAKGRLKNHRPRALVGIFWYSESLTKIENVQHDE